MPFKDGTGPSGDGPRTGRGLGPCDSDVEQTDKHRPTYEERPRRGLRRNTRQGSGGRGARNRNRNRNGQK